MTADLDREEDVRWFAHVAAAARWRFAKTYVESYPHEYTLLTWMDPEVFSRAILCIERWGVVESFWSRQRKYLYLDERKYWHMGDPTSADQGQHPSLINRTWLDVSRYRDNARELGYDDADLERLVQRWHVLLQQARRLR